MHARPSLTVPRSPATLPRGATVRSENRRSPRVALRAEAWLETPSGEVVDCLTLNVSDGGACLVGIGIPIHVGDRIRLSFDGAAAQGWLDGLVRWRSADRIGIEIFSRRGEHDRPRGS